MVTVEGFDRRFWLLGAPGGLLRFLLVVIFGVFMSGWSVWVYNDLTTSGSFGFFGLFGIASVVLAVVGLLWWVAQKPRLMTVIAEDSMIEVGKQKVTYSAMESWTIVDLPERALLILKFLNQPKKYIEVYIDKDKLAESGLVNILTQKATFDPEMDSDNSLLNLMRICGLY